ncbi:ANTAR domain-containing protein [Streptomyces sp. NPDC001935]
MIKTRRLHLSSAHDGNRWGAPLPEVVPKSRPCTGTGSLPGRPRTDSDSPPNQENAAHRISQLQEEISQLRSAIDSHAVVDQAIGVVISLGGIPPDQGFDVLRTVSQHTNVKLREVAEQIVTWVRDEQLDQNIRQALSRALQNAEATRHTTSRGARFAAQNDR